MSAVSLEVDRDRHLRLASIGHLIDARPEILQYVDTIRKASEWRTLGFTVPVNDNGNPARNTQLAYRFFLASERDPVVQEAIATGKRAVTHPLAVYEYFRIGCDLSEFVTLPLDVRFYCHGRRHYERRELVEALPLIEQACSVNQDEVRYRELLYPLRLALGDLKAIQDEFAFFRGDIDSMVHSGRANEWLRLLQNVGDFATRDQLVIEVEAAFAALCSGQSAIRRYGTQSPERYQRSLEEFRKLVAAPSRQRSTRGRSSRPPRG
jgi:hypothetical protein